MYLKIGGSLRGFREANVGVRYKPIYDSFMRMVAVKELWDISGRVIQNGVSDTVTTMTAKIQKLKSDFGQYRPDLVLLEDDGITPTSQRLYRRDCVDGPTITELALPNDSANVFETGISYTATAEGTRPLGGVSNAIIEFEETLTPLQGGEIRGLVGGAINPAEWQIFQKFQPYIYVQAGTAVGMFGYPQIPEGIWPQQYQLEPLRPRYGGARKQGPIPSEYVISWEYKFGSTRPLIGAPHTLQG